MNKLFNLFKISILARLYAPFQWVNGDSNAPQAYIYEHLYGPVIVCEFLRHLPSPWHWVGFGVLVFLHLILKELILDRLEHGQFNIPNIAERTYGLAMAALVLVFK